MSFDVVVPLFPSFVQPSSSGNIHVDFPTTSSKNVVILNDLLDIESDLNSKVEEIIWSHKEILAWVGCKAPLGWRCSSY
jgi:hypothetical protein